MSRWEKYRASRTSWGINVLGSFCVEIEGTDGTVGFATGFGGMFVQKMKVKEELLLIPQQVLPLAGLSTSISKDS